MYSSTWNPVEPFVTSHCYVPNKAAGVGLSKHIMFVTTPDMAGCIEINCGRHYSEFLQNKWTHNSTSSLSNSIPNLCFMYIFHSSYESNWCWGFIPAIFQAFFNRRRRVYMETLSGIKVAVTRQAGWGTQWTSTHHHTIQWMHVITQLWMNLNWVNILFHFGNQFCKK